MNINFEMDDFDMFWNTGAEIKSGKAWFSEAFPPWRLEHKKGSKSFKSLKWFYWIGENSVQALVAYKLLQGAGYKTGLFWASAPINEDGGEYWGYVVATDYQRHD